MNYGDIMVVEKLKEIFEREHEVKFKLYSLEYIIKEIDNKIAVYPILYETKKSLFNSFEDALNNYTVYNESIIDNINRIIIIK